MSTTPQQLKHGETSLQQLQNLWANPQKQQTRFHTLAVHITGNQTWRWIGEQTTPTHRNLWDIQNETNILCHFEPTQAKPYTIRWDRNFGHTAATALTLSAYTWKNGCAAWIDEHQTFNYRIFMPPTGVTEEICDTLLNLPAQQLSAILQACEGSGPETVWKLYHRALKKVSNPETVTQLLQPSTLNMLTLYPQLLNQYFQPPQTENQPTQPTVIQL